MLRYAEDGGARFARFHIAASRSSNTAYRCRPLSPDQSIRAVRDQSEMGKPPTETR